MRLSEAIRLGSLLVQEPTEGRLYGCALGMGMRARGATPRKEYWHEFDSIGRDCYWDVRNLWPHLWDQVPSLPCCPVGLKFPWPRLENAITHAFDVHVMGDKSMTIEALCDKVKQWEDELAAKGVNVEQVTMAAELTEPASQAAERSQKELAVEANGSLGDAEELALLIRAAAEKEVGTK